MVEFPNSLVTGNSTDNHLFQAMDASNQIDDGKLIIFLGGSSTKWLNYFSQEFHQLVQLSKINSIDDVNVNSFDMRAFSSHIDSAINSVNSSLNFLGINQRTLSGNETNLFKATLLIVLIKVELSDTDFAKEQSNLL